MGFWNKHYECFDCEVEKGVVSENPTQEERFNEVSYLRIFFI